MAGKLWDDNNFTSMKMDEYCKDLDAKVGDDDEPMILTRVGRLWQERWEVSQQPRGRDTCIWLHIWRRNILA